MSLLIASSCSISIDVRSAGSLYEYLGKTESGWLITQMRRHQSPPPWQITVPLPRLEITFTRFNLLAPIVVSEFALHLPYRSAQHDAIKQVCWQQTRGADLFTLKILVMRLYACRIVVPQLANLGTVCEWRPVVDTKLAPEGWSTGSVYSYAWSAPSPLKVSPVIFLHYFVPKQLLQLPSQDPCLIKSLKRESIPEFDETSAPLRSNLDKPRPFRSAHD